jgi:hypothetical protein
VGAAVRSGNISLVKNLLSKGGNFKGEAPCGALVVENVPMLELLLDHLGAGANISMVLIRELLDLASERHLFDMYWFVIKYTMDHVDVEFVFSDSEDEDL